MTTGHRSVSASRCWRRRWPSSGGYGRARFVTHAGHYYRVHTARLYTVPDQPPAIMVAAAGTNAAELAGRIGDGLISVAPSSEVVETYRRNGGDGPRYEQIHVCWAPDEQQAVETAHRQ